jgi:N-acetylmuramoyl-L-alanine amidase
MKISHNILIITILLGLSPFNIYAQKSEWRQDYLTVVAQAGDNVFALLNRYGLADYHCNVNQFCKINNLLERAKLKPEGTYKLPICVAPYNGKSIRSTLGIEDWKSAKRIETYNKFAQKEGLRPESFIDNRKLWVPFHELSCPDSAENTASKATATKVSSTKPSAAITGLHGEEALNKGSRKFPIFGKSYEYTPLIDRKLKNKVFYLVSGHGGPDVGAQGKRAGNTLCEDEYAYDVTLRLGRLLLSHGASVYLVVRDPNDGIRDETYLKCDKDEEVWGNKEIPYPQKERLLQRTDFINEMTEKHLRAGVSDQTVIEIHVDSRSEEMKTDLFFYYRPDSEASKALANKLHQTFHQKYLRLRGERGYNGTVSSRNLLTLNETTTPKAVYIEMANIQNDWDQQRIVLKNNRQAVANWIYQGLSAH